MATQKIISNFWFDKNAEDAANFYVSVFKNGSIGRKSYYTEEGFEIHKMPAGSVMTIEFELNGQKFVGLNGGPIFKFTEAVSYIINCADQQEIDYYWEKLGEGGDKNAQQCGWLKDKFGLSWQVIPEMMTDLFATGEQEKTNRMMHVMMQMKKLDIAKLQAAYDGK